MLRKHIAKEHPDISLARAPIGKPTQRCLDRAKGKFPSEFMRIRLMRIDFYRRAIDDYEARKKQEEDDQKGPDEDKSSSEPSKKRRRLD